MGGDGNDSLTGGGGEDSVDGGLGNDRVVMQASVGNIDVANGGAGVDTLAMSGNAGGTIVVDLSAGAGDQVTSLAGLQNNFENLDASDLVSSPVNVTGSTGANIITGSSGADTMAGGLGNDTYRIQSGDQVTENAGQGADTVILTMMSDHYTLPDNVEHLVIQAWEGGAATGNALNNTLRDNTDEGISLSGGGGADVLIGGTSDNNLTGGAGTDTLAGGHGNDTYRLNPGANVGDHLDRIVEAANQGTDTVLLEFITTYTLSTNVENGTMGNTGDSLGTLRGNALDNILLSQGEGAGRFLLDGSTGNDNLVGSLNADTLIGGVGNDTLRGGGGADNLSGGDGNDYLQLGTITEVYNGELINGGAGSDILQLTGDVQLLVLDLTAIANNRITGIEIVDITGGGNNTLVLNVADVLDLSTTTNTLRVDGDAGDTVDSQGQGWMLNAGAPVTIGAQDYNTYVHGLATLLIDTDITQTIT